MKQLYKYSKNVFEYKYQNNKFNLFDVYLIHKLKGCRVSSTQDLILMLRKSKLLAYKYWAVYLVVRRCIWDWHKHGVNMANTIYIDKIVTSVAVIMCVYWWNKIFACHCQWPVYRTTLFVNKYLHLRIQHQLPSIKINNPVCCCYAMQYCIVH